MVLDPPRKKVDVFVMIIFSFIPILGIYAAWRIQKFWMLLLLELGISIIFGIAIIPLAFFMPELAMIMGVIVGIGANVLLVKYYAEKYNEKIGFPSTKSEKITNYIQTSQTPIRIHTISTPSINVKSYLGKFFTKKGLIIGAIIAGIIFVGVLSAAMYFIEYGVFIMINDAMSPLIKQNDFVFYDDTPFNQVNTGDVILYYDSGKVWVHKVIKDEITRLVVKSNQSFIEHDVSYTQYIGKVTKVYPSYGLQILLYPYIYIPLMIGALILPSAIMRLRK